MDTKENNKKNTFFKKLNTKSICIISILIFILIIITIYSKLVANKESYAATSNKEEIKQVEVSQAPKVDIEQIIKDNNKSSFANVEIVEKQEELEYITKYRNTDELYKGETRVAQEGRNGIQTIRTKKTYDENGKLINEEQIAAVVTKSSINKIIEVGTKIYVEPPKENVTSSDATLGFNMALNKPSGFSMEQFKAMLTDSKDKNKIFQNNAEYFYYIEDEYNINGVFVAAVGIHESNWGTSSLAVRKYNLFGYGAYDSNPYNGAYSFSGYSESIDLIARVFVKYYINPSGTKIYDGQAASGKYYNGNTLSGVNKKYATDKNWANAVYKYMEYLYNKI